MFCQGSPGSFQRPFFNFRPSRDLLHVCSQRPMSRDLLRVCSQRPVSRDLLRVCNQRPMNRSMIFVPFRSANQLVQFLVWFGTSGILNVYSLLAVVVRPEMTLYG